MNPSSLLFKYLNLGAIGGRGGVQRFFMLANDINFKEELFVPGEEWAAEKKRMMESGENPCGGVPVSILAKDDASSLELSQHISTCRYLARVHNLNTGDAYKDYIQDLVADEYQAFRATWVEKTFSANDEEKAKYRSETLPQQLTKFDTLYKKYKTSDVYLSTSPAGNPLWGDSAVFGLVRDNIQTGHMKSEDLAQYTYLSALFEAYAAIPAVATWIEEKTATSK